MPTILPPPVTINGDLSVSGHITLDGFDLVGRLADLKLLIHNLDLRVTNLVGDLQNQINNLKTSTLMVDSVPLFNPGQAGVTDNWEVTATRNGLQCTVSDKGNILIHAVWFSPYFGKAEPAATLIEGKHYSKNSVYNNIILIFFAGDVELAQFGSSRTTPEMRVFYLYSPI